MNKNIKMVGLLVLVLGASSSLLATMDIQKAFTANYPDAKAKLGKCSTCHTKAMPKATDPDKPALNCYGNDVKAEIGKEKVDPKKPPIPASVFTSIEGGDSNKDGVKNGDQIKAGNGPGADCKK